MKILVVDDHVLFREGLVSMLKSQPDFIVVGEAVNVQEAIEKTRQLKPGLVLMDFLLPDGRGSDATKIILSEFPQTKVVFLTMHDEIEYLMEAVRSGAQGYLLKDLPFSKLISSLRALERGEAAISRNLTMRLLEGIHHNVEMNLPIDDEIFDSLDQREIEILRNLSHNASNEEIANHLSISTSSVKYHIRKMLDKLNLENRKDAARYARQKGLGQKNPSR